MIAHAVAQSRPPVFVAEGFHPVGGQFSRLAGESAGGQIHLAFHFELICDLRR